MLDRGTYFSTTDGTTAKIAIGIPSQAPLTFNDLGISDSITYTGSIGLNTFELSASLLGKSKTYQVELQITSGSQVTSWQHPVLITHDIISNLPLVHVTGSTFVISASYSAFALSASHALTSDRVAFGDSNQSASSFMYVRGEGGALILMGENSSLNQIDVSGMAVFNNDGEVVRISQGQTWFSGSSNVGIGVSFPDGDPNNKLQVGGNIICSNITASNLLGEVALPNGGYLASSDLLLQSDDTNTYTNLTPKHLVLFSASNDTRFDTQGDSFIYNPFNFGVGTAIPSEKLEVAGNILCSNITASKLLGTASRAISASYAPTNLDLSANSLQIGQLNITPSQVDISSTTFVTDQGFFIGNNSYLNDNSFRVGTGGNVTDIANGGIITSGNISAVVVTASLFGTASWAVTASYAKTASFVQQAVSALTANAISFVPVASVSASWVSASNVINTASYANTASYYGGTVTSASYATIAITCSGIVNANQVSLINGFANYYAASVTASNVDDGRVMVFTSASKCFMTGSLSSTFSTMVIQSGSGQIAISASSDATLRNRQGQYSTAGAYAAISIIRLSSGDFLIFGDTA